MLKKHGIQLPVSDNKEEMHKEILRKKVYEINEIVANYYHQNLYTHNAKSAQEYVKKRKLDNNTLKKFMIGYSNRRQ